MYIDYDLGEAKDSLYLFSKKDGQTPVLESVYQYGDKIVDLIESDPDNAFGKSVEVDLEDLRFPADRFEGAVAAWYYDTVALFVTGYGSPYVKRSIGEVDLEGGMVSFNVKY